MKTKIKIIIISTIILLVVIFIAGAVNVLLSILSVLIPLRKFSRVKIIELIK